MWLLFTRHIKDKKNIFFLFALLLVALTLIIVYVFPTISRIKDLQKVLASLPPFIKELLGQEMLNITEFTGFMGMRYYNTTLVWMSTIFTVLYCGNIISGDIGSQRMDIILSQPISRFEILTARYVSYLFYLVIFLSLSFLSVWLGSRWMGLEISSTLMGKILIALFPLQMAVGSICLLMSCLVDDPMVSTAFSLGIFLFLYFFKAILALTENMASLKTFNLFYYFDATRIVKNSSLNIHNFLILLAIATAFYIISAIYFQKKEIYV